MPRFECFRHIENPLINIDQAVAKHYNFSTEPHRSPIPIFAEWLSVDQEGGSFTNSGTSDGFNHSSSSNFQDPFMNESVNEMFSSQFKFETGNEFIDLISENDINSDFNVNYDVPYI
ncbi:hypothetical protein HRI_004757900 [Hibiscus trionum]|uniref:Uncharacterized protein n=1 Tax=Hibiscus trionum TaxID=183268 RepID=A0A9W7MSC2_HIBTR|nr:hypothetical protein HRI_004757900 [Hibiscus trionum]